MSKFEKILQKILIKLGFCECYKFSQNDDISMVLYKNETSKEIQYYIVSNCNVEYFKSINISEQQSSIYNLIKKNIKSDPAFDKNTSWLMGLEISDNFNEIEQKLLAIEEDPYCFKKMICTYTLSEIEKFEKELGDNEDIIGFIQKELANVERFNKFNSNLDNVYSFISRLAIKLPIIRIKVEKNQKIEDLKEKIEEKIEEDKLSEVYSFLQDDIDNKINMIDIDINKLHDMYFGKDDNNEQI